MTHAINIAIFCVQLLALYVTVDNAPPLIKYMLHMEEKMAVTNQTAYTATVISVMVLIVFGLPSVV